MPREIGMIFADAVVPALLNGKKTQTRRPVSARDFHRLEQLGITPHQASRAKELRSPWGGVGDLIYGRECFLPDPPCDHEAWSDPDSISFYYGWAGCGSKLKEIPQRLRKPEYVIYRATWPHDKSGLIWRPSIHMPKWAARIWLRITDVWIESLSDISVADALAEGIDHKTMNCPRHEFFQLWNALYGDNAHEKDPYVWRISFERVDGPDAA